VCTTQVCSFYTPSHNISCELDTGGRVGPDSAYCQTVRPPQSVHMESDGGVHPCTGDSCLGNAGVGTPILAYGQTVALGPFSCVSAATGVTCTVTSGRGFAISDAGITPVG